MKITRQRFPYYFQGLPLTHQNLEIRKPALPRLAPAQKGAARFSRSAMPERDALCFGAAGVLFVDARQSLREQRGLLPVASVGMFKLDGASPLAANIAALTIG